MRRFPLIARLARWWREPPPEPPPDPQLGLERLVDALRLAALPAEQQAAALPAFVQVPDEVIEVFGDSWVSVPWLRDSGAIDDRQQEALARLDRQYEEMVNAPDAEWLLSIDGMGDGRWLTSRQLAAEALAALGRTTGQPTFAGVTWVPGRD
jgi:hypothetical protein